MAINFYLIWALFFGILAPFKWVSFDMIKRSTSNGALTTVNARVCYQTTGQMTTYFPKPIDIYVVNNVLGNIQVYNPSDHTVINSLDNRLSSQNTTFYSFLLGDSDDLGLVESGFKLVKSNVEDMMLISRYSPPRDFSAEVGEVELVNDGEKPIFMGYLSKKGAYLKKIYFGNFKYVAGANFPMSITEITYVEQDSVITKTSFSNFKFDDPSDTEMVNFRVPETAKLTK